MNEKTITLYTYEYYNHSLGMYCASNFNWTTKDALDEYLGRVYIPVKVISKTFSVQDIKSNPNIPFVSDYVREAIR